MKNMLKIIVLASLSAFSLPALASLNILACEPEWGALATELGGERVTVYNATTALQDPHQIQARPSLLAHARNADLLACTGAELEAGWLPILLRQSGNANIQPGRAGYFEAAAYVRMLEIPARLDRAEGDVHASGNPHIQTDPRNIALVADALAKRLGQLDPANAAHYQARHKAFADKWQAAIQRWEKQAAPLKGMPVVVQHKAFPYLSRWLGLHEIASLEPKPGVEPSSGHLGEVLAQISRQPVKMVLRAAYQDGRSSEWLAERARIHAVALPFTVGGSEQARDLFGLFDDTLQKLLAAAK
ncbi:MAG: zinc ABC transporter substrate-binding protein [Nitrosomonadales bacterium]|nr:MAG: zinc ABC transporter substrate-binding protein [Nitrosomonadales bacterium]